MVRQGQEIHTQLYAVCTSWLGKGRKYVHSSLVSVFHNKFHVVGIRVYKSVKNTKDTTKDCEASYKTAG